VGVGGVCNRRWGRRRDFFKFHFFPQLAFVKKKEEEESLFWNGPVDGFLLELLQRVVDLREDFASCKLGCRQRRRMRSL